MTQLLNHLEPEPPACGAPAANLTSRCDLGTGHVGDHLSADGTNWPAHTVIRLEHAGYEGGASTYTAQRFARLADLAARYDAAKAEADDAAARLKAITDGIKAEVSGAFPGGTDFTITSGYLSHPLTLQQRVSERLDTKLLRGMLTAEQYASLTKPTSAWYLARKK